MHNFIYEISFILHYLVQCQCSSFYIFAGLVYGFVAQKMATILCSWRSKIKTICSFSFCTLFFSLCMLFLCIYAIVSLLKYILYVTYYLKTAGWNINSVLSLETVQYSGIWKICFCTSIFLSWNTFILKHLLMESQLWQGVHLVSIK
jgi:hypothetical protein